MRYVPFIGLLLAVGLACSDALVAAPPPPPPPGVIEGADAILRMPRQGDLTAYGARFADDVVLTDGHGVAVRGRDALLRYLRERQALRVTTLDISYGNPIMAAQNVSSIPDTREPGVVHDCCFWARLAIYHRNDAGKVDRVDFIENGSYWGPPENPK